MTNKESKQIPSRDIQEINPALMGPLTIGVEGILVVDPLTGAINTRYGG